MALAVPDIFVKRAGPDISWFGQSPLGTEIPVKVDNQVEMVLNVVFFDVFVLRNVCLKADEWTKGLISVW